MSGTVLIVDDDAEAVRPFADWLQLQGYEVRTASDGEAAWPHVRRVLAGDPLSRTVNSTASRPTKWRSVQQRVSRRHQFTNQWVLARDPLRLGRNQFIAEHQSPVFTDAWLWTFEEL